MSGESQMGRDLGLVLPEIAVVLTAVMALCCGMLRRHAWALPVTLAGLTIATVLTIPLIGDATTVFGGTYRIDDLSLWAKLILLPATALTALLVAPEARGTDREATVYALLSFSTVGALALSAAGDMMFLVLGVLLSSLGTFALVCYPRNNLATEAATKYFVFGAVSGGTMIFGLSYWYGAAGTTLLHDLSRATGTWPAAAGLFGVLVGLGFKAGLAPFHFWVPDAYDGAPLAVAAYLSIVPKIGAVFALAGALRNLPTDSVNWRLAVAGLAVLSMIFGNLAALAQTNVVRLMAYSSIAQTGYLVFGVIAFEKSGLATRSLVVFSAAYAAMNLGMFAIIAIAGRNLDDFSGLARVAPWTAGAAVAFLLSLVGVPPFAGFVGKLLLFGAAIDAGYSWLAVIGILNSVLSLAVYLRVIVPMYEQRARATARSRTAGTVGVLSAVLTLAIGVGAEALMRALNV